ncbi:MAG: hypothetical protein JXA69_02160 [Phycisphaerae bacterium]|nr:hypothetical protein [Phycisphaerae bacterium]
MPLSNRQPGRSIRTRAALGVGLLTLALAGCEPQAPPPFVPMQQTVSRVNVNNMHLGTTAGGLKGSPIEATVQFREHPDARPRKERLHGSLRFTKPRDLILSLRHGMLGEVMQAGSNEREYWLWVRPEINKLWWGTYAQLAQTAALYTPEADTMPLRPEHLIEALGLNDLPDDTSGIYGPVYRPEPERNVLIFLEYDRDGKAFIWKEYHIDRREPFLIREILFREMDGQIRMHAQLSEYKRVRGALAVAAHTVRIDWPAADSWLDLRIRQYTVETDPDMVIQPENPREYGAEFKEAVCVDPLPELSEEPWPATTAPASAPTAPAAPTLTAPEATP